MKPPISYSKVITHNSTKSPGDSNHSKGNPPTAAKKAEPELPSRPTFAPPALSTEEFPQWNQFELIDMLNQSYCTVKSANALSDFSYIPESPVLTPICFPQTPSSQLFQNGGLSKVGNIPLFVGFAFSSSSQQRTRIARELGKRGWMFNPETKQWCSRLEVWIWESFQC